MGTEMKINFSDDEEDLEALRLAALSSIKKKELQEFAQNKQFNEKNYKNSFRGGKRRFFPGQNGRNGRNGQFNNPVRNSNLISIPTITEEKIEKPKFAKNDDEPPKLIRPQDRYANSINEQTENEAQSSKFDRYNNSNSDSEEDDEITASKLPRTDSLEALMEELDAEIQGEAKKEPPKTAQIEENADNPKEEKVISENEERIERKEEIKVEPSKPVYTRNKHKSPRKNLNRRRNFNPEFIPNPMLIPPNPPPFTQFTTVYNAVPQFPDAFPINVPPPTYVMPFIEAPPLQNYAPPLQPLIIDPLPPPSMAPLSPRSAAFVLENRAIVEKRKRSPRRSYSRSPSPRLRTPPRRSPRRSLSPARRIVSPRRSPARRSLSPCRKYRREASPGRRKESPRKEKIKERLGEKKKEEMKKSLDPVLEARKKKFETKEIKVKEGVIRLKPKEEKKSEEIVEKPKETSTRIVLLPRNESKTPPPKTLDGRDQLEDAMNELEMLLKDDEALELSAKVEELFTDEEMTDQENEGRFKVKKEEKSASIVPLRRLMNGAASQAAKKQRKSKEPLTNPIENRKIEIKIRNPAKYEKKDEASDSEPEIIVENEEEVEEAVASREGDLRAQLSRKRAERQNKHPSVEGVQSRLLQSALEGAVFKKKRSKKKDKEIKDVKVPIHLRLGVAQDTEKTTRKKSKKRKHAIMDQV